jgi:hypothetical protein
MTKKQYLLEIFSRLAGMFQSYPYQTKLESYLKTKSITDLAMLEKYIKEFVYKELYK